MAATCGIGTLKDGAQTTQSCMAYSSMESVRRPFAAIAAARAAAPKKTRPTKHDVPKYEKATAKAVAR